MVFPAKFHFTRRTNTPCNQDSKFGTAKIPIDGTRGLGILRTFELRERFRSPRLNGPVFSDFSKPSRPLRNPSLFHHMIAGLNQ
jgi:hypothetical protein